MASLPEAMPEVECEEPEDHKLTTRTKPTSSVRFVPWTDHGDGAEPIARRCRQGLAWARSTHREALR